MWHTFFERKNIFKKTFEKVCIIKKGYYLSITKRNNMNTYTALVNVNGKSEVVEVKAKNLKQAKEEAGKIAPVICVAKNTGSKIYF